MTADPPTDGLLVLNLFVAHFDQGPAGGATRVEFTADDLSVVLRPRVNGSLQAPQTYHVATGSTPLFLYRPEVPEKVFAGEYWLPPGELEDVTVHVTSATAQYTGSSKTIKFYTGGGTPTTAGTIHFATSATKPEIYSNTITGLVATVPAGSGGALSVYNSTTFKLNTALTSAGNASARRFPYDSDELVVYFLPSATSSQIATLESTTGATEILSRPSGLRILRFSGASWGSIVSKLMVYRASSIGGVASLNPTLVSTAHDPGVYDDPYYSDSEAAYLADIGVEAAWSDETGSRDVVIGMIDSGLDIDHPDLVNALWVNVGELPDVCSTPFVDEFDLDGDGVFTLHDLNAPTDPAALTSALADLSSCNSITLTASARDEAVTSDDDGVFQGSDLIAAFADDVDDDANGVVDDFFGANFTGTVSGCGGPADANGDVMPDELASIPQHGTQMAGLIGAEQDNGRNIAGVMGRVRIIEARIDDGCDGGALGSTDGGFGEIASAMDYLEQNGAQIVVFEKGSYNDDTADHVTAEVDKWTTELEDRPGILFLTAAGNWGKDCDDPNAFCFPASNTADNALRVAATGIDETVSTGVMDGIWTDPYPRVDSNGLLAVGTNVGPSTLNIGAPGYIDHDVSNAAVTWMPSLGFGQPGDTFGQWVSGVRSATGGTSAAVAVTAGVAGVLLAHCPTHFASGADLRTAILDGANVSPAVDISGSVGGGRYLDAVGALGECP